VVVMLEVNHCAYSQDTKLPIPYSVNNHAIVIPCIPRRTNCSVHPNTR